MTLSGEYSERNNDGLVSTARGKKMTISCECKKKMTLFCEYKGGGGEDDAVF